MQVLQARLPACGAAALHQHLLGGLALGIQTTYGLFHALQLRLQSLTARIKQLALVVHLGHDHRIAHGLYHFGLKVDFGQTLLLGLQAALHGAQAHIALANGLKVGLAHRRVQAHQHLIGLDLLTLAHQHLLDDAPRQMLHRLALGIDGNRANTGHTLVQRRQTRPQQKAAKTHGQHPQALAGNASRIGRRTQSVFIA